MCMKDQFHECFIGATDKYENLSLDTEYDCRAKNMSRYSILKTEQKQNIDCKGWNEQMFRQQTDHCTTNFKTNGTKTFVTFLHKSIFLQAVAETVLMSIILLNTEN